MRSSFLSLVACSSLALMCAGVCSANAAGAAPQVKLTPSADRVRVEVDGKLFTEYVFSGALRPYLYPVLMPDGTQLVRDFPIKDTTAGEDLDHPHHRSLWFSHSRINGIDCWNEGAAGGATPKGSIAHDALLETTSGAVGRIRARSRWLAPDGSVLCTDETTILIRGAGDVRMVDFEVTMRALADKPLLIGDNKDGTMAIRLAQWMTMPHKYKTAMLPGEGHFVTSTGMRDGDAWGKRADWCDAYAPRDGKIYGVAIFDHPQNLRHPTWWMARDYGLFGANPFGQHDYENLKDQPNIGDYTIPAGGSLTLRYRFVFHTGDEKAAKIADLYREYAAGK